MRYIVLAVVAFLAVGCEYENNYYYGVSDAGYGVGDMAGYTDEFGEYHETEPNQGIFSADSKLQGQAQLSLAPAPALIPIPGFPVPRLPFIRESVATMNMGATLIDLATKDNKPHVVTLSFGKTITTPLVAAGPFTEVVAVINMGIGGTAYYAEVDVVEGLEFSLAVNRMQVTVVYCVPYGGGAVPVPAPTVNVGVSVSSDVIAHGRQPQRTIIQAGTIAAPAIAPGPLTNGVLFIIPSFSKAFKAVAVPLASQYNITLATVTGANAVGGYAVVAPATQEYPIPSGAYWAVAQNAGLAAIVNYALIFDLAL